MILIPKIKDKNEYEQYVRISTQLWGGVPVDTTWARETNLYKETMKNEDRILGTLFGLIAGDAYGTRWEFKAKESMPKEADLPDEILGGGPFELGVGDWTDDSSMALCLAESLVENGWDVANQMHKYISWWKDGKVSVKGYCFDIGYSTKSALSYFDEHGQIATHLTDNAGNGCLMRLAAVPMYFAGDEALVMEKCGIESTLTHPAPQAILCAVHMGYILNKIYSGTPKTDGLFKFNMDEYNSLWESLGISDTYTNGKVEDIFNLTYKDKGFDDVTGSGYVVSTWEAALWAFYHTDDYLSGLKKVVSLGEDTDTTAAVYGQLAGAYYGFSGIPHNLINPLTMINKITNLANGLYAKQ